MKFGEIGCFKIAGWKRLIFILTMLLFTYVGDLQAQCSPNCSGNGTALGVDTGDPAGSGTFNNSYFGHEAGKSNLLGHNNSFFGRAAGRNTDAGTSFEGSHNSFFGSTVAFANTTGYNNSFFGSYAGRHNTTGFANSFFGRDAGYSNSTAIGNCFFGTNAGRLTDSGGGNCFYGASSGSSNSSGHSNCFFGNYTGIENSTGNSNCFIGSWAGNSNRYGSKNCYFGFRAGHNIVGGSNIVIGYFAGPEQDWSNVSNRLYIDNHSTYKPLIYGEFDNHFVRINGTFEVTAGLSNPSSRGLKANFKPVKPKEILKRIQDLDIQQWVYKERPDELHVGPVAEDFYAAFGLGADNKHISTIDADGVMMAAIQALKAENDALKRRLTDLEQMVRGIAKPERAHLPDSEKSTTLR